MSFSRKILMYYLFGFILCFLGHCSAEQSFDFDITQEASNQGFIDQTRIISFSANKKNMLVWYRSAEINAEKTSLLDVGKTHELIKWDISTSQIRSLFKKKVHLNDSFSELLEVIELEEGKQAAFLYRYKSQTDENLYSFAVKLVNLTSGIESEDPIYQTATVNKQNGSTWATFAQSRGFLFIVSKTSLMNKITMVRLSDQSVKVFMLNDISKTIDWEPYLSEKSKLFFTKDQKQDPKIIFWLDGNQSGFVKLSFDPVAFNLTTDHQIISLNRPVSITLRNSNIVHATCDIRSDSFMVEEQTSMGSTEIFSLKYFPACPAYNEMFFSEDGSLLALKKPNHRIQVYEVSNKSFLPNELDLNMYLFKFPKVIPLSKNQAVFVDDTVYRIPSLEKWEWDPLEKRYHFLKKILLPLPDEPCTDACRFHEIVFSPDGSLAPKSIFTNSKNVYLSKNKYKYNLHIFNEQAELVTINLDSLGFDWDPIYLYESVQEKQPLLIIRIRDRVPYGFFQYRIDLQNQKLIKDEKFIPDNWISGPPTDLSPKENCVASYFNTTARIRCQGYPPFETVAKGITGIVPALNVYFSPSGRWLQFLEGARVGIIDLLSATPSEKTLQKWDIPGTESFIDSRWLSENHLLTIQVNGMITIWDVTTGSILKQKQITGLVSRVSFLQTEEELIVFMISQEKKIGDEKPFSTLKRIVITKKNL